MKEELLITSPSTICYNIMLNAGVEDAQGVFKTLGAEGGAIKPAGDTSKRPEGFQVGGDTCRKSRSQPSERKPQASGADMRRLRGHV